MAGECVVEPCSDAMARRARGERGLTLREVGADAAGHGEAQNRGSARRRPDPRSPIPDDNDGNGDDGVSETAECEERWLEIRESLRRLAGGRDDEDLVQETLLLLLNRLGHRATVEHARGLGSGMLRCLRIDEWRRTRLPTHPFGDSVLAPEVSAASPREILEVVPDPRLLELLGRRSAALLVEIVGGLRETKALARRMKTSPCAIRRLRTRTVGILAAWLARSPGTSWEE